MVIEAVWRQRRAAGRAEGIVVVRIGNVDIRGYAHLPAPPSPSPSHQHCPPPPYVILLLRISRGDEAQRRQRAVRRLMATLWAVCVQSQSPRVPLYMKMSSICNPRPRLNELCQGPAVTHLLNDFPGWPFLKLPPFSSSATISIIPLLSSSRIIGVKFVKCKLQLFLSLS